MTHLSGRVDCGVVIGIGCFRSLRCFSVVNATKAAKLGRVVLEIAGNIKALKREAE